MNKEQNDKKELEGLFRQWRESAIDNKDIPRLMHLLDEADAKGELSRLMKEAYLQIGNSNFFSRKEKRKIFLHAIKPAVKTISFRRKIAYSLSVAASILLLAVLGYYFFVLKNKPEDVIAKTNIYDIAAPTQYNGLLTLGNNNHIEFASAATGTITSQQNVSVTKRTDGSLSFTGTAKKIVMNQLTVPRGSKPMHLLLADGTSVLLNVASSITFPNAFTGNERKVTLTGEAYFEVKHDPAHPFIVSVGKSRIKVLGTHFNVDAYDDESAMKVTLIEGKVNVDNSITLKPGQQAIVGKRETSLDASPNLQSELAWTGDAFVFDGAGLTNILATLSKWYNFSIEYKSTVPQGHFTGTISKEYNLSQVLKILESGGVHCRIEKDTVIVL